MATEITKLISMKLEQGSAMAVAGEPRRISDVMLRHRAMKDIFKHVNGLNQWGDSDFGEIYGVTVANGTRTTGQDIVSVTLSGVTQRQFDGFRDASKKIRTDFDLAFPARITIQVEKMPEEDVTPLTPCLFEVEGADSSNSLKGMINGIGHKAAKEDSDGNTIDEGTLLTQPLQMLRALEHILDLKRKQSGVLR